MSSPKDKRLKSFEIVDTYAEADKISSAFVIPVNDTEADIIVNDDEGKARTVRSGGGDRHWTHEQFNPATTWHFTHPLNKKVSVTIQDTAGSEVEGEVTKNDGIEVILNFNFPFSGFAYLN